MPPTEYTRYRAPSECTIPDPTQLMPTRIPPHVTMSRAPSRSTRYPSNGTSHVSVRMKSVNVICTADSFTLSACVSGMVNRVHAYCRLAMAIMAMTPARSLHHRRPTRSPVPGDAPLAIESPPEVTECPGRCGSRIGPSPSTIHAASSLPLCRQIRNRAKPRTLSARAWPPGEGEPLLCRDLPAERDHAWDLPRVPHRVDLLLEVLKVLFREVGEAALLEQVLAHRLARATLHDGLGLAVVTHHPVLHLVEWEDAGLDRQLAQLVGEHRVVVPALRARVQRVDEGRPADGEGLADLVHHLDGVRSAYRGHVPALGVAGRQHARGVLLPARVDETLHGARRAEGSIGAVGGGAGELDVRVGVGLVVVHQDERVVLLVGQGGRDRAQPHVRTAAVTAERDDVDRLGLHLALLHEGLEAGGRPERSRAGGPELGVHPRHHPQGRVVRR